MNEPLFTYRFFPLLLSPIFFCTYLTQSTRFNKYIRCFLFGHGAGFKSPINLGNFGLLRSSQDTHRSGPSLSWVAVVDQGVSISSLYLVGYLTIPSPGKPSLSSSEGEATIYVYVYVLA